MKFAKLKLCKRASNWQLNSTNFWALQNIKYRPIPTEYSLVGLQVMLYKNEKKIFALELVYRPAGSLNTYLYSILYLFCVCRKQRWGCVYQHKSCSYLCFIHLNWLQMPWATLTPAPIKVRMVTNFYATAEICIDVSWFNCGSKSNVICEQMVGAVIQQIDSFPFLDFTMSQIIYFFALCRNWI